MRVPPCGASNGGAAAISSAAAAAIARFLIATILPFAGASGKSADVGLYAASPRFHREQARRRVESQRPVPSSHRRQEQLVDEFVQRLRPVGFRQEEAHPVQEYSGDRFVIAFAVAVPPADALIEAADDAW